MKRILLVVILLSVPLCAQTPEAKSTPAAQQSKPSAPAIFPQDSGSQSPKQGAGDDQPANEPKAVKIILPQRDIYDIWAFWISVTLAGVGIVGIVVGVCTLLFIKAQADYVVTTGRPWMAAKMLGIPQMVSGYAVAAVCHLENCGKSVAYIVEIGNAIKILKDGESLPDKFPCFDADHFCRWDGNGIPLFPEGTIERAAKTGNSDIGSIFSGKQVLWFYGYVKYRDAFIGKGIFRGPLRETRYSFRWQRPRPDVGIQASFFVEGPPEYNRAS